ncbi:unnamed protein product [Mycetohabitans rhizoxinica HKI 454]|uniref:Uncharacterized protein n=1 Tax=Mycetohabitans rhizoxinica (strain DSM 19002 / CIP 109453 / HKI 454) TaxID=882378 RepID=E5ART5_MYCRK|nr:unnamed protein product [Mycetohabitans rhizoxinica HKI 454]
MSALFWSGHGIHLKRHGWNEKTAAAANTAAVVAQAFRSL